MLTQIQESYKDLIFYQIYPRSFKDANGDGIGDLRGIIEKLDYLVDLGINAVWLSPCYKSPNDDNGYDISDFCDIGEEYGTLEDWKEMISEMHKHGIKLIMDFVPNHTSSAHKWFQESRKSKDNPYRDFYYWSEKPVPEWRSVFGGSAWEYDEMTGEYYLHSHAISQPDLNWENPKVREAMLAVVDYWVDLGVDGFRCDVMDMISKDFEQGINRNGPKLHEYIHMLFGREKTKHIFTVGECWGAQKENITSLVDGSRGELSTLFQFSHLKVGRRSKFERVPFTLDGVRDVLVEWQEFMRENELLPTLFLENHDTMRIVDYYGNPNELRYESATLLATMYFLQAGIPFIYQGQEIGVTNSWYTDIKDFNDIETHNFYHMNPLNYSPEDLIKYINFGSRDNARRPMPWDDSEDCEFGSVEPWIPKYTRYKEINVKADREQEKSIFNFYKDLIRIRKESNAVRHGVYENLTDGREGAYIYKMTDKVTKEAIVVVCNFKEEQEICVGVAGECILSNYEKRGQVSGMYKAYECAVFKMV